MRLVFWTFSQRLSFVFKSQKIYMTRLKSKSKNCTKNHLSQWLSHSYFSRKLWLQIDKQTNEQTNQIIVQGSCEIRMLNESTMSIISVSRLSFCLEFWWWWCWFKRLLLWLDDMRRLNRTVRLGVCVVVLILVLFCSIMINFKLFSSIWSSSEDTVAFVLSVVAVLSSDGGGDEISLVMLSRGLRVVDVDVRLEVIATLRFAHDPPELTLELLCVSWDLKKINL